ncbi:MULTISPECIES: amidohydrolase [unclassified Duganella]|uniref:amidohydrolase n=1 Tax=unclassified Duganella TaxID=2636909 RepID=UPI000885CF7F|nr:MULTISPECIES: amidohydrolase [unclassified Duganella]SDG53545.1 carboxypeptidase Ss1. Metallo peptidase. MEROPS family M20D [Duganella sp. OV458]SDJ76299.1 carboxypeptidase Ss1. Metallo peptidase. MEROPS family M20D [Duganella sp. OV510]
MKLKLIVAALLAAPVLASAASPEIERLISAATPGLIAIRHDIHQHPELGNRETRTSALVAERLRKLGLEVQTGIAGTGVVGVLKGALPGPVIGLRSELDALPVTEQTNLPYASKVQTEYNGKQVGVAHVCGHDIHIAILLGVAEVLAADRKHLKGTIKFIFQPAEEGAPDGEEGGAALMVKQGVLNAPTPEVFFSTHVGAGKAGAVSVSRERTTAASDIFVARIIGKSTHAAAPWRGVDPVPAAALAVLALQTIPSRQSDLSLPAPVISIGKIEGGIRQNIIPGEVRLEGTIRSVTRAQRDDVVARLERTFKDTAESTGATADFKVLPGGYPAGANNSALVDRLLPVLKAASTTGEVRVANGVYAADDMAEFSSRIPAVSFGLGATPDGIDPATAASNHSPHFLADDSVIAVGVRAFTGLIAAYSAR